MTKSEAAMVKRGELTRLEAIADRVLMSARRVAAKRAPSRKAAKVVREAETMAHRRLVCDVLSRPGPDCELGAHECPENRIGVDPHHLECGPTKTCHEKMSNVIRACRACHEAWHMNPRAFVPAVKAWCALHGYPLPKRRIFRESPPPDPASPQEPTP